MPALNLTSLVATARARPGLTALIALLPLLLPRLIASYRGYLALGRGGLPHSVVGWVLQLVLRPFAARDVTDARVFRDPSIGAGYYGRVAYLPTTLDPRRGERPKVPGYVAPQRQTTDTAPGRVREMNSYLASVAAAETDGSSRLLAIRPSGLESPDEPALFLTHTTPPPYITTKGEIAHVHPEGSSHVVLSLPDADTVVSGGWGARHPLSGSSVAKLPLTYVLVYAPRDDREMEAWKEIVKAAVKFATAGLGEVTLE